MNIPVHTGVFIEPALYMHANSMHSSFNLNIKILYAYRINEKHFEKKGHCTSVSDLISNKIKPAERLVEWLMVASGSFMYIKKSSEPRILPCRIPESAGREEEFAPSIET